MTTVLPATVQSINEDLHTTVENQAKKSIQMHYLAKNMAEKMHQRVQDVCKHDFGGTFFYSDVYFGKDENDDIVTVEEYVEGDFVKYINGNACICRSSSSVVSMKAQSLVHFSYETSEGKLINAT